MTEEIIDKRLSLIVSTQILLFGAKNALIEGMPFLYTINDQLNLIISGIVAVLYIYALLIAKQRTAESAANSLWWAFIIITFLITFIVFPQNIPYLQQYMLRSAAICFLTCFIITKIRNFKWLIVYLTKFSYILIGSSLLAAYFIHTIGHVTTSEFDGDVYGMSLSYVTLTAVMWLLYDYFTRKKITSLFFSLIGVVIIILFGSRNPLLAIFAYIAIQLVSNSKNSSHRSLYKFLVVICALMLPFYKYIIVSLGQFSESFGFTSRTLSLLSEDEIDMSNRDIIHAQLINQINENWLTGLGVAGDYATIQESAHSFYLSIFCTYGYVIGILFLSVIAFMLLKAIRKSQGYDKDVLILYLCLVFPRTFTGGDIWINDNFWWLIGITLIILGRKRLLQY